MRREASNRKVSRAMLKGFEGADMNGKEEDENTYPFRITEYVPSVELLSILVPFQAIVLSRGPFVLSGGCAIIRRFAPVA